MHWCVGVEAAGKLAKNGTLAIQQKVECWQFNRKLNAGNSTKVEIQQNWKLKISSSVSFWQSPPIHSTNLKWSFLCTHCLLLGIC